MEPLKKYLTSRPALNLAELERLAALPKRTLYNWLQGHKPFPTHHVWPLCVVLSGYGLELQGYEFMYDDETDIFFTESKIDEPPEVIDHGDHFEYRISVYRNIISNEAELINFLNPQP